MEIGALPTDSCWWRHIRKEDFREQAKPKKETE